MIDKITKNNEWRNYWLTRSIPFGILAAVRQIGIAIIKKLRSKVLGKEILLSYLTKADLNSALKHKKNFRLLIPGFRPVKLNFSNSILQWANKYHHNFELFQKNSYKPSEDPEDYWTLNQFGWLFVLLIAKDSGLDNRTAKEYISWWIKQLGKAFNDKSWRSFSVSERLSNWFNIFQLLEVKSLEPRIIESIWRQIKHLVNHLEEYCDHKANNHLINNGRALYIIGKFLNHKSLTDIGRIILINESKKQITSDGFLNEGSSHYHLLATKNYLEGLRIASLTDDNELIQALSPVVIRMLRASALFLDSSAPEEWQIPYIGNISPDFPPALFNKNIYFWQLVKTALESKKDAFLNNLDLSIPWFALRNKDIELSQQDKGWKSYEKSGYYRWNNKIYQIWLHARRKDLPRRHSHNDWGSFQMHIQDEPLIIDPGRESYSNIKGSLTLAQNCLRIDDFEQAIFKKRDLFVPEYLKDGGEVKYSQDNRTGNISICIHGYKRLKKPVTHTRTFHLMPDSITIKDILSGKGQNTAIISFHLHPEIRCTHHNKGIFSLITPKGKKARLILAQNGVRDVNIKKGGSLNSFGGYCSTAYGIQQQTTSIFAHYEFNTPTILEHKILIY